MALKISKKQPDIMSLVFHSLKNKGKLAFQKIIVTGTVTFTYHLFSSDKLKVINYCCPMLFNLWYSDVSQLSGELLGPYFQYFSNSVMHLYREWPVVSGRAQFFNNIE